MFSMFISIISNVKSFTSSLTYETVFRGTIYFMPFPRTSIPIDLQASIPTHHGVVWRPILVSEHGTAIRPEPDPALI